LEGAVERLRAVAAVQTSRGLGDAELLKRFATERDEAAFAVLAERHGPMVMGVCRRALGDAHDADDAWQATFLILARRAGSVRRGAALGGWLHRVATSVCANLRRQQWRRHVRERRLAPRTPDEPAAQASWCEVRIALDEELGRLPERYRAPLVLCYLEGQQRDEAAARLGLAAGALHGRLERGRELLRQRLLHRGLDLSAMLLAVALGEGVARAACGPALLSPVTRAAAVFASGEVVAPQLASPNALSLAQQVLRGTIRTKLRAGVAMALLAGLLVASPGGQRLPAASSQDTRQADQTASEAGPRGLRVDVVASPDVRQLERTWRAVEMEQDGKRQPSYDVRSQRLVLVFKGGELSARSAQGPWGRFSLRIYPDQSPRAIDLTPLDARAMAPTMPGIYALDNGRLWLCFRSWGDTAKRPVAFGTRARDGLLLLVCEAGPARVQGRESGSSGATTSAAADEFGTFLYEWRQAEKAMEQAHDRARTPEERRQILANWSRQLGPLAERCVKLARSYPDTTAALAALCWAVKAAPTTDAGRNALAALKGGRMATADLHDLADALHASPQLSTGKPELAPLVLGRVKRQLDHPKAGELLAWVCAAYADDESPRAPRAFSEAADLIANRFATSPNIQHLCEVLGVIRRPRWAGGYEKHLRTILRVNPHSHVRAEALFALAQVVQESDEARQEEARKLYQQFVMEFTGRAAGDGWDQLIAGLVDQARQELDGMLVRAIGEPAPDTEGEDLDGRPMKLADFRGKVVLVSFWANWCGPCMKFLPHERALFKRLADKPFALVGVNGDTPQDLKKALDRNPVSWRSFKDSRPGRTAITHDWRVLAFPTLYLIDHKGIIRKRWIGAPAAEELDREIDRLVAQVPRTR
jgi:RNA polymerase sigma factor (sigma-70 family)